MFKYFVFAFLLGTQLVLAQDATIFKPDSIKKQLVAVKINNSIKIDGNLSENEWQLATPYSDFTEIDPHQGAKPKQQTFARVLYNQHHLFVGVFSKDSLGKKATRVINFKRDFEVRSSDFMGLVFDGFNDERNCMVFTTNPYGVQRDFLSFDATYLDLDWDGLWKVRTSRTDSGWVAEYAIPWKTLRYSMTNDSLQTWGFNINRGRRVTNENYAMSPFPRSFSVLRMDYAGKLTHLKPPPPTTNIRIQPYFLVSNERYKPLENGLANATKPKIGGELKWAINSTSVLDLTFNTDFAQADADRQVNNVSRFSVFFPERRQFFLENASLFGIGIGPNSDMSGGNMRIQPFFSRKIGLDDSGNPIPIDAGARFVHRSLKTNYGGMYIRQRESGDLSATNFFVGRFSQNFGKQNRIGGLLTVKQNDVNTNILSTADGFFRFNEANSMTWLASTSTDSKTSQSGFSGAFQYYYATNQVKIWWTESVVTKNYNPEVGFVSRNDVIGTTPGLFWYNRGNWIPFKKIFRSFEPGFSTDIYHQASTGKLIERSIMLNPIWFMLQSGGFIGYVITPTFQYLDSPFVPLGVSIGEGKYNYTRHTLFWGSDGSKKLSITLQGDYGSYFDGKLNSTDINLKFSPIPHIAMTARFNRNNFKEVGVENTNKTVDLLAIEGRFALNPRLQLIGFYQRNTDTKANNYNIRLSWEYQPLSFIYIVLNKRSFQSATQPNQTNNEDRLIAKISYLHQF